jgi:hypothetical protein
MGADLACERLDCGEPIGGNWCACGGLHHSQCHAFDEDEEDS